MNESRPSLSAQRAVGRATGNGALFGLVAGLGLVLPGTAFVLVTIAPLMVAAYLLGGPEDGFRFLRELFVGMAAVAASVIAAGALVGATLGVIWGLAARMRPSTTGASGAAEPVAVPEPARDDVSGCS